MPHAGSEDPIQHVLTYYQIKAFSLPIIARDLECSEHSRSLGRACDVADNIPSCTIICVVALNVAVNSHTYTYAHAQTLL